MTFTLYNATAIQKHCLYGGLTAFGKQNSYKHYTQDCILPPATSISTKPHT